MSVCRRILPLVLLVAATTLANVADNASPGQIVPKSTGAADFAGLVGIDSVAASCISHVEGKVRLQ
jgi:hypothetical protein